MSRSRYYLVRRECREFLGPMAAPEFKQRFDRLEFGMQDEVSGHCGPWVVLDRKDELLKHYPELAKIFGEDLPLSWRENTGHAKVISRKDSRKDQKKNLDEQRRSRNDFHNYMEQRNRQSTTRKVVAFLTLAVSIAVSAFILIQRDEYPSVDDVALAAQKQDPSEFLNIMGLKVIPQAGKLVKSQKQQIIWLPYLRMYAYFTTGAIDGVPQKLLRGDAPMAAPQECSVDFWKRKWRESSDQNITFVQGKSLQKNPWTKLLTLDPEWVRRRPQKGWSRPRSYLEGCIMTAFAAMRSLASGVKSETEVSTDMPEGVSEMVLGRLRSQLDVINNGRASQAPVAGFLSRLSCLETQARVEDLNLCINGVDPQFKPLLDERIAFAVLRIAFQSADIQLDKQQLSQRLQSLAAKFQTEDVMGRLDLGPETKMVSYLAAGDSPSQALSKIEQEYPDLKFK